MGKIDPDQWDDVKKELDAGILTRKEVCERFKISRSALCQKIKNETNIVPSKIIGAHIEPRYVIDRKETIDYRIRVADYLQEVMDTKAMALERIRELIPKERSLAVVVKALEVMDKATLPITQALVDELTQKKEEDSLEKITQALISKGYGKQQSTDQVPGD